MAALNTVTSPSVSIELGGRIRQLRMDLNAMALIYEQSDGVNLIHDVSAVINPTPRMLQVLTWACLVADDPELAEPEDGIRTVGSWINFGNAAVVIGALTKAFQLATPEPGSVTTNGETPKNQRRGSAS